MAESGNGNFKADISDQAIAEALRSVEKVARGDEGEEIDPMGGEGGEPSPEQERARALEAMLEDSTARARETQERLRETHDRYVRLAADFDNWKKRAARERDDTVKFGTERLVKDVLPVLDNLDRALGAAGSDPKSLLEGVRLVMKQLEEALGRHGVKGFSAVGQPFDPSRHEALMQQPSELPPNTVVSELVKGYLLHDRLVRPAAVVVSTGPAEAAGEPVASTDEGASE